jgi:PHP family Zn ribbon phosphoesterase
MSPRAIVQQARRAGLNIIGICDHNSAENVGAAKRAAQGSGVTVLPGMEVSSREEVHVLLLFDDVESALRLQETIYGTLAPGDNDDEVFGPQVVVNEHDEVVGFNRRLLIGATTLSLQEVVDLGRSLDGLLIASHVDREAFGLLGQLGFIPQGLSVDALEISPAIPLHEGKMRLPQCEGYPLVTSSDAHELRDIGKSSTVFCVEEATTREIRRALLAEDGREVLYQPH